MSVGGIALLLGVSINTVKGWRKRAAGMTVAEALPPPVDEIGGIVYWWSDEIIDWAQRTGRPVPSVPEGDES